MEEINIKLTNQQIRLLQDYRDKSYVMNVLMTKSYERYAFIKQITNIPLIVSSSAMAIINSSSFKGDEIKLPNIIINSLTALTIAMIGNFQIGQKEALYQSISTKFLKLTHKIEDDLTNNIEDLDKTNVKDIVDTYDSLIENITYVIPSDIQNNVKKIYKGTKTLPAFLNCEGDFIKRNSGELPNNMV
tara:strand:+ start:4456 stop:5019 length:564 start_codon:yes stop_codon:yes gene_type:complete